MKRILCWVKAIPLFLKCGAWCPHIYKEVSREEAIIIATKNSFRVAKNFIHRDSETVHPKATLIRSKCECCGKEDFGWYDKEPFTIET